MRRCNKDIFGDHPLLVKHCYDNIQHIAYAHLRYYFENSIELALASAYSVGFVQTQRLRSPVFSVCPSPRSPHA